jgi:hypothetical protein
VLAFPKGGSFMKTITIADRWARLARELGVNATVAGSPITDEERSELDVVSAEFVTDHDKAFVVLRVKTKAGRVLEFDMELPFNAMCDASSDYDEVDGELVEHVLDLTKPAEDARYFGEAV